MTNSSKPKHSKTLCSEFVGREKTRYERKGYGLFVAFLIAVAFFLGMPRVGQAVWPHVL